MLYISKGSVIHGDCKVAGAVEQAELLKILVSQEVDRFELWLNIHVLNNLDLQLVFECVKNV